MNKIIKAFALVVAFFTLVACSSNSSSSGSEEKAAAANSDLALEIVDGSYIVPKNESTVNGEYYLALNVKITNKSDQKISVHMNSFELYDSDDKKLSGYNIYGDNNEFHTISTETISAGKSATGYVVYKVDKKEKYELQFEASSSDYENEVKPVSIEVDASKYTDDTDKVMNLAKEYVNEVFLNGAEAVNTTTLSADLSSPQVANLSNKESSKESSDKDKDKDKNKDKEDDKDSLKLSNNLEEERSTFTNLFITEFKDIFYYYEPSQAEAKTFVDAYVAANAKRATIQYSFKSYTIDSAEIYVKPSTIDIDSIDTSSIIDDFVNNNKDSYSDYNAVRQAAEKYVMENLPGKLDSTGLASGKYMPGEGYTVRLTKDKDSNTWTLDSSNGSGNGDYARLVTAFMGNL